MENLFSEIPRKVKSESGNRYGTLLVVGYAGITGAAGHATWLCLCDCGNNHKVTGTSLRSGGCVTCPDCRPKRLKKIKTIHGSSHGKRQKASGAYKSWSNAKKRCYDPTANNYHNYGGRGIKICDKWLEPEGRGFLHFLKDMGERPEGYELDRIDVNGNYEPSNCRWVSRREQSCNTRYNRVFEVEGQKLCISEIADKYGVKYHWLYHLLITKKTSIEEVLILLKGDKYVNNL